MHGLRAGRNAAALGSGASKPGNQTMDDIEIVRCSLERHAAAILEIFNDAIETSTALYDYKAREPRSMVGWFEAKQRGSFPVIGVEDRRGTLLAFGSYGSFRAWPAYKYTVEHSVYVHRDHRGRGLGRLVMQRLIEAAREQGLHAMIGGIDAANAGSIALHTSLGFRHVGTLPQVGFKFGRWLDLAFYELLLDTPASPVDG
jgi:phosphinothricin acetyltransferase